MNSPTMDDGPRGWARTSLESAANPANLPVGLSGTPMPPPICKLIGLTLSCVPVPRHRGRG